MRTPIAPSLGHNILPKISPAGRELRQGGCRDRQTDDTPAYLINVVRTLAMSLLPSEKYSVRAVYALRSLIQAQFREPHHAPDASAFQIALEIVVVRSSWLGQRSPVAQPC